MFTLPCGNWLRHRRAHLIFAQLSTDASSSSTFVVPYIHRNHKAYWGRANGGGGRGREEGREIIPIVYLSLHCHYHNDSCIKMASDESHFNVSLVVRDKVSHKSASTDHNLFEEKGEPKRNRAETVLLTSLTRHC